jgi:hypothetical protein
MTRQVHHTPSSREGLGFLLGCPLSSIDDGEFFSPFHFLPSPYLGISVLSASQRYLYLVALRTLESANRKTDSPAVLASQPIERMIGLPLSASATHASA